MMVDSADEIRLKESGMLLCLLVVLVVVLVVVRRPLGLCDNQTWIAVRHVTQAYVAI
jgi:hypothetical protein